LRYIIRGDRPHQTRQITSAYTAEAVSGDAVEEQRKLFERLLKGLGEATTGEIKRVLDEREVVKPASRLESLAIGRLREKLPHGSEADGI